MSKAYKSIKAGLTEAIAQAGRDPANVCAGARGPHDGQAEKPAVRRIVTCPGCGRPVEWVPENRYRPFCSARCKGVDLGAWATDKYRVEASEEPHPQDQSE